MKQKQTTPAEETEDKRPNETPDEESSDGEPSDGESSDGLKEAGESMLSHLMALRKVQDPCRQLLQRRFCRIACLGLLGIRRRAVILQRGGFILSDRLIKAVDLLGTGKHVVEGIFFPAAVDK